jgi:hypothetical protein
MFAELQENKAGKRVFTAVVEGQAVVHELDVYAEAGGRYTALDRSVFVTVIDGTLDIDFLANKGEKPIINAILVTHLPEGAPGT